MVLALFRCGGIIKPYEGNKTRKGITMNKPTMQTAINSAIQTMNSDDAIESVEIEFTLNGIDYTATFDGIVKNIHRSRNDAK